MNPEERREQLYDAYLERLLAGVELDPASFLEREQFRDPELLKKLRALHLAARIVPQKEQATSGTETPEPSDLPRAQIGDYRLLQNLGQGGMGQVFLAEQRALGRQVALKLMQATAFPTPQASLRFQREARSLARLRHPHVVTVFDYGVEEGLHYLVMEYVPGQDLSEVLRASEQVGEPLQASKAVRWAAEIARALEAVHQAEIVHRDVKPSNIRITPEGSAILVDFGLVSEDDPDGPTLTHNFLGSPSYASPEQVRGLREVGPSTDLYALGTTLFRCLCGRLPFETRTVESLFHAILHDQPPTPRQLRPGLPRDLDLVVRHAMEKQVERRYASAKAFACDLEALLAFRPIQARAPAWPRRIGFWARRHRASAAALGTAALATLGLLGLLGHQALERNRQRTERASNLLTEAQQRFAEFVAIGKDIAHEADQVINHESNVESSFLTPEQLREWDRAEDAVLAAERQRERLFNGVLDLLDQAEELDEDLAGTDALRAEFYLTRHLESERRGDTLSSRFYRAQAQRFDPEESLLQGLQPPSSVRLRVNPPGPVAVAWFQYIEQADVLDQGDHRMVPQAVDAEPKVVLPGTWCLIPETQHPQLQQGDCILAVDGWPIEGVVLVTEGTPALPAGTRLYGVDGDRMHGGFEIDQLRRGMLVDGSQDAEVPTLRSFRFTDGVGREERHAGSLAQLGITLGLPQDRVAAGDVPITVLRDGKRLKLHLEQGLATRRTSVPWLTTPASWTTFEDGRPELTCTAGPWVLLLRREGFEDAILPLRLTPGSEVTVDLQLVPRDSTPKGFRRIEPGPFWDVEAYALMEHEVTSAQYLSFLQDPTIQARIDAANEALYFPRTFRNASENGFWLRDEYGRFQLPEDWDPQLPVVGISWFDAVAYADWRTQQAIADGLPHRFRLPTLKEFRIAARGTANWDYPYGPRFRPQWSNSCFSRPTPAPEPVMRYPVDESVYGIFDTSGSVLEWLDAWWDHHHVERFAGGGSWAQGGSIPAKPTSGLGIRPQETSMETGFRLVMTTTE